MKTTFVFAFALLLVCSAVAQTGGNDQAVTKELLGMERQFWEAWKNNDVKPYEEHTAAGSFGISVEGLGMRDEMLQQMKSQPNPCKVNSYTVDDASARVMNLGNEKYLVAYQATVDAVCGGQKIPDTWWVSTIWEKKGGKWMALFHQETPVMMPPPGQQPPKTQQ
jgi:hypothetical protein